MAQGYSNPGSLEDVKQTTTGTRKYQEMKEILKSGKPVDSNKTSPDQAEIDRFVEEDAQFWDFKYNEVPNQDGKLARFENKPTGQPDLFLGNLSGPGGTLVPCNSFPILADSPKDELESTLQLGEVLIESIEASELKTSAIQPPMGNRIETFSDANISPPKLVDGDPIRVLTSVSCSCTLVLQCDMGY